MTTMNDAEREAFRAAHRELDLSEKPDAWGRPQFLHSHVEVTWRGFQAGAAWQRAQGAGVSEGWRSRLEEGLDEITGLSRHLRHGGCDSTDLQGLEEGLTHAIDMAAEMLALLAAAPATPAAQGAVPDVSAMARVLSDRSADACNIDRDDNWAMYGQEYIEDVQAMLAACPAHQAERQETVCPDCLDTGRQPGVYGPHKCHCNASAERQDRGEVQSERVPEWIPVSERLPADSRDVLVYCSDTDEHMVGSSMGCGRFAFAFSERGTRICCKPSHWRYIEDSDKPSLAASTGQEVGK